jgi:hypothetical protein
LRAAAEVPDLPRADNNEAAGRAMKINGRSFSTARKRVLWISIAGVILMPSCATAHAPRVPMVRHIEIDSAFANFFTEMRDQQRAEFVLCLYGAVRNDTAFLNFVKPAKMRARTETSAAYDSCPRSHPFAMTAQYLGVWHGHNVPSVTWDDLCRFSTTDDGSFESDRHAFMELLSCRGRLMARAKYK